MGWGRLEESVEGWDIARMKTGRNWTRRIVINGMELGFVNEGWFSLKKNGDTGTNVARMNFRKHVDEGLNLNRGWNSETSQKHSKNENGEELDEGRVLDEGQEYRKN